MIDMWGNTDNQSGYRVQMSIHAHSVFVITLFHALLLMDVVYYKHLFIVNLITDGLF